MKNTLKFLIAFLPLMLLMDCSGPKMGIDKTINANQLANEYSLNAKQSDKLYKGKYLTIIGEVAQSYTNKHNENIIILMQKDKSLGVKCILNPSANKLDRPLKQGETVKLNGLCQGLDDHVIFTGCVLLMN